MCESCQKQVAGLRWDSKRLKSITKELESISCLCAEGPEVTPNLELFKAIQKEILAVLEYIKKATEGK